MQTEQAIVELSYDILCRQKIVEYPLFAERFDVGSKDRRCIRAEVAWLVDCDEDVLQLQRFQLEITRLCDM